MLRGVIRVFSNNLLECTYFVVYYGTLRIPISVCLCEVDVVLEKEVEEVYTQTRRAVTLLG